MNRRDWLARAGLALCTVSVTPALRAEDYPVRPVRIVVPFGAGTGSDVLARTLAAELGPALGQSVVVLNKEGAGGVVGTKTALASPADGHTLLLAANPFVVSPLLYDPAPYDALKDFVPVAKLAVVPNVLVAHAAAPVKTARDLVAYAKAHPGKLNFASSGVGTPSQLETRWLESTLGIDLTEVPYKSTAQAMTDVAGGQVALYFPTLPAALPHIRSGKLVALGIGSARRSPQAPEIPTLAEALALPDYQANTWYGLVVRSGTPGPVVAKLVSEVTKAMRSAAVGERVTALGGEVLPGTAEDFAVQMRAEAAKWAALVRKLGLRIE